MSVYSGQWSSDIPNEETEAAMEETEALLKKPAAETFLSVDELFVDLRS